MILGTTAQILQVGWNSQSCGRIYRRVDNQSKLQTPDGSYLIEFDENVISYEDLIVEWARIHSPTRQTSRQYRSVLFYGDDAQKEIAQDALRGLSQKYVGSSVKLYVDIEKCTKFYQAEEYHQHYFKKKGMDYR